MNVFLQIDIVLISNSNANRIKINSNAMLSQAVCAQNKVPVHFPNNIKVLFRFSTTDTESKLNAPIYF